ncbi:MAG: hypothetical protein FIA82_05205 [Melioribacter sp.]|nr:hypothetical protein [Melioribacter sp.]
MSKKKVLLSFVGTNDAGKLLSNSDGAILTALKNEKFDEVILIWNETKVGTYQYSEIVSYLSSEILKRKLSKKTLEHQIVLKDITDHNEIYSSLKLFTDSLPKTDFIKYSAAISSGTPSMQVCWILLAESGDFSEEFPLRLIKVKDPKFGKSLNIVVKLSSALPRIIRLKEEVISLKQDLIPVAEVNIQKGILKIRAQIISLTPIEFCYYRYFAERAKNNCETEKYYGFSISLAFMKKIYSYHEESFPSLDLNREDLRKMIKSQSQMPITTFRGNVSKINRKIREYLDNETLISNFSISIEGKRGAKFYSIKTSPAKIIIN